MNPENVQACDTRLQTRDKGHPFNVIPVFLKFEYVRNYCAYQTDKVNLRPNLHLCLEQARQFHKLPSDGSCSLHR